MVLATGAQADPLLMQQPLGPDGAMIAVDDRLQVKALKRVFASGDVADFPLPQPKNGVIAVRQAATLYRNLLVSIDGSGSSQPFQPPKTVMNLLSYSNGHALMSHRWLVAQGRWVWWLKRWIDTCYMKNWV